MSIDLTNLTDVKELAEVKSNADDVQLSAMITAFSQYVLTRTGQDSLNSIQSYTETYDGNGSLRMFLRNRPIVAITSLLINGKPVSASTGYGVAGYFIEQGSKSIALRSGSASSLWSGFFAKGLGNIQVTYAAGYPPRAITNEAVELTGQVASVRYANQFVSDVSVTLDNLAALTRVALPARPLDMQYVEDSGQYAFNAAQAGLNMLFSYTYSSAPADLEMACREAVSINYKRKSWQDLESKSLGAGGGSGTTRYRPWALTPSIERVILSYQRVSM